MAPLDRLTALRGTLALVANHPVAWAQSRLWHRRFDVAAFHEKAIRSNLRPGESFLDVGAMWRIDGARSFLAERLGAATVTALDVLGPTPRFEATQTAQQSAVTYVHGDINAAATVERVNAHDVVWCSGVLYHSPDPFLTLHQLRRVTRERLILATEVAAERALRAPGAMVLPTRRSHPGAPLTRPRSLTPADYGPWYFLPTASAVRTMLRGASFRIETESRAGPFHRLFVAR